MKAFKDIFDSNYINSLGNEIYNLYPAFEKDVFNTVASDKLDSLEYRDRVTQIAKALYAGLNDYEHFYNLAKLWISSRLEVKNPDKLWSFESEPFSKIIELYGLDDFDRSFELMEILTQHFTAEFCVRPYLLKHQDKTLKKLLAYTKHTNFHIRRFASEGCRPRLPWGLRFAAAEENPYLCKPILDALIHDPHVYVQTSVANHLNDYSHSKPIFVLNQIKEWHKEGLAKNHFIIKRGSRNLIKHAHADAFAFFGHLPLLTIKQAKLSCLKKCISLGEKQNLEWEISCSKTGTVVMDFILTMPKKNGTGTMLVKGLSTTLKPGQNSFIKSLPFKPVTTRTYYAGKYTVELQINGEVMSKDSFELSISN